MLYDRALTSDEMADFALEASRSRAAFLEEQATRLMNAGYSLEEMRLREHPGRTELVVNDIVLATWELKFTH